MQDFTNYQPNSRPGALARSASSEALFFQRVYTWMCAGLALTAGTSFVLSDMAWAVVQRYPFTLLLACVLQLGLVWYLSSRLSQLAPATAKALFLIYALVTGAVLSFIFVAYSPTVIVKAFVCTAGVYGAMAVYGLVTKRSLEAWGSFLFMGLVGLILASVVNMFVASGPMDLVICVIGVLIFSGLTAYDHQKLRVTYATGLDGTADQESRVVIGGALSLYLDFINLFLYLLRFLNRD